MKKCFDDVDQVLADENASSASPEPGAQQSSFEHFKRFVKSLNGNDLGSLLQFLTGNNIIGEQGWLSRVAVGLAQW